MEELDKNIDNIILKHLLKEATEDEQNYLLKWLKSDAKNLKYFFNMKEIWNASQNNSENFKTDNSWIELNKLLAKSKKLEMPDQKKRIWKSFIKYAALIIVLAGLSVFAFKYGNRIFKSETLLTYTEIKTPFGQKKEVILPDGTDIWINSGTTFKYASNFGETNREVFLQGEAYFNVAHDKTKTFIVHAENITIKVLGTSFNVKCYPELKTVETTVITGTVSLENNNAVNGKDVVILNKKEKATYLKDEQKMYISKNKTKEDLKQKFDPIEVKKLALSEEETNYILSWKDQVLSFNNETFEEIALKLQRWFNVKIIIKDEKLKNYRYKGKFDNVKSIFQVLEVIKLATPIIYDYNEKNKEIIIKEKK